jgi:XTP/dITP diphosphohydrolase
MELIFATHNNHKLEEITSLLKDYYVIHSLNDLDYFDPIPEPFHTFHENAIAKARTIYDLFRTSTFADDSGLEIDALDGEPGVLSARYAEELGPFESSQEQFEKNISKVLSRMKGITNRKARFRSVIASIIGGKIKTFEGIVEGVILSESIGREGFGYDPIFQPEGHDISFAQMSLEDKNLISHRARALEKLVNYLNFLTDHHG